MNINRRYTVAAALVGVVVLAAAAFGQAGMQLLTSLTGSEVVSFASGTVSNGASLNTLWGYGRNSALLYTTTATASTGTGTTEQTLATYSLPANTLNVGTKLRIKASFSAAANTDNKTFKCYFGASVITSGVLTTNGKNGSCEVIVTKTGASTQIVYGNMLVDTTAITGYKNAGTDTDTAAIVIKFTGTDGTSAAGDIVLNDFSVERLGR